MKPPIKWIPKYKYVSVLTYIKQYQEFQGTEYKEPSLETTRLNDEFYHLINFYFTYYNLKTISERINLLKFYSEIDLTNKIPPCYRDKMYDFRRSFPQKPYNQPCNVCLKIESACLHHIIQIQYGGDNLKENKLPICNDCHKEIHTFLK
jgi:hypothetical protein